MWTWSGENPGAMRGISPSVRISPRRMKKNIAIPMTVAMTEKDRYPSSSRPSATQRAKIGMKVIERAPPARR